MRRKLWPDLSIEENERELAAIISGKQPGTLPLVIFVAEGEDGGLLGFIEVGLRSHADGCDPRIPAGFIEGWFVGRVIADTA
jgi:aminoglycoside 6'-N-acetyltransferase I